MKKGQEGIGLVERVDFPNKGVVRVLFAADKNGEMQAAAGPEETKAPETVTVKNTLPGQKVRFLVNKARHGKAEGRLLGVMERSPKEIESPCPHFDSCGGCTYQTLPYEETLAIKREQVLRVLTPVLGTPEEGGYTFEGIKASPIHAGYRNKMEFSFGDEYKDGPLSLGMHKRGSFYDIVTTDDCRLVHQDFCRILKCTLEFFREKGCPFFHKLRHEGYLRHLLVRRGILTSQILVDLVTSTGFTASTEESEEALLAQWARRIADLPLEGTIAGILHTRNDSPADVVANEGTDILVGQDYFYEELLGLKFRITPFSFFQTNSLGAQVLYETAREYALSVMDAGSAEKPVIFDLYSGTGTIGQMMAPVAKKVIGVEIVAEAVEAAIENAERNGLHNCNFLAGDVLKVLDDLKAPEDRPDLIILDPPRDGIHPKALPKIIDYGAENLIYISCKVTSLARDLVVFKEQGYRVSRVCAVDMFPGTGHVETVVLMSKKSI